MRRLAPPIMIGGVPAEHVRLAERGS